MGTSLTKDLCQESERRREYDEVLDPRNVINNEID